LCGGKRGSRKEEVEGGEDCGGKVFKLKKPFFGAMGEASGGKIGTKTFRVRQKSGTH